MPITRNVFVLGALALAGIPILNGFWSKELVLESGLSGGPLWAYVGMLLCAGLTALYTFRCVWMVFYGQPRSALHAHEAGTAMRVALYPLAVGALTTWMLAGPFGRLLAASLPLHEIDVLSTRTAVFEIIRAPATLLALGVVALGLAAWWQRERLAGVTSALQGIGRAAANSFGFEWINRQVVDGTQVIAEDLRAVQTGQLSWNVVGILLALVAVLAFLVWGA
jgi:NADH-quinone oxidoreductase subunit L